MSAKSRWQSAATAAAAASTISSKTKSRKAQRGVPLNMMVVGSSGLGKSTFVRSLVEKELIPTRAYDEYNDLTEKTVEIVTYSDEIEADGQKILLTVIDTPGFGDNIDNSKSFLRILEYTETQHKRFLAEETRVQRNAKFQDTRVHVILYFISPTGHYLKDLDIVFMKQLGKRANIIPVIGKADTLLPSELKEFKARLMEDIQKHGIPIFDFPVNSEDDEEIIKENKDYRALLPFSIVTSNDVHEIGGEQVPARKYPWGTVLVSDPKHSDFESLKVVLLISHLEVLKEITNDVHYEHFREESLTKAGGTLESKQIEDELKEFETLENEIKEKLKSQRDKRVSLKLEKSVKRPAHPRPVSKTDSKSDLKVDKKDKDDTDSIDEGKKKKKPKKSGSSVDLLEEGDEKKKKKKKKKDEEDGKEDGKEEGKEDEE